MAISATSSAATISADSAADKAADAALAKATAKLAADKKAQLSADILRADQLSVAQTTKAAEKADAVVKANESKSSRINVTA